MCNCWGVKTCCSESGTVDRRRKLNSVRESAQTNSWLVHAQTHTCMHKLRNLISQLPGDGSLEPVMSLQQHPFIFSMYLYQQHSHSTRQTIVLWPPSKKKNVSQQWTPHVRTQGPPCASSKKSKHVNSKHTGGAGSLGGTSCAVMVIINGGCDFCWQRQRGRGSPDRNQEVGGMSAVITRLICFSTLPKRD